MTQVRVRNFSRLFLTARLKKSIETIVGTIKTNGKYSLPTLEITKPVIDGNTKAPVTLKAKIIPTILAFPGTRRIIQLIPVGKTTAQDIPAERCPGSAIREVETVTAQAKLSKHFVVSTFLNSPCE